MNIHADHRPHDHLTVLNDGSVYCGTCHQDADKPRAWGIARLARIKALIAARKAREADPQGALW